MADGLTNQILRTMTLFKDMDKSRRNLIADKSRFIDLKKGNFLVHKGDSCTGFYVIVYGNIKISFISIGGKEHVVRIVGPGQSFGEAMMFLDKPSPATVQTITAAKVLFVPRDVIFQCTAEDANCAHNMLANLSRRIFLLASELESLTLDSSQQRVIGYLLQHLHPDENAKFSKSAVELPANKSTIALHLNLAPETLSRVLHQLNEKGLIQVEGKVIRILDVEKLRHLY
jgi:CRP-like cAMP-binding protein